MVKAVIIGHGQLAQNCLNTLSKIVGELSGCTAISNEDLSQSGLRSLIERTVEPENETIIFVDFFGSNLTASKIAGKGATIISGFNVPMLISFFTKRDRLPFDKLVRTVIDDGIRGIKSQVAFVSGNKNKDNLQKNSA